VSNAVREDAASNELAIRLHEAGGWSFWFTAKRGDQFRANSDLARLLASIDEADTTERKKEMGIRKNVNMGAYHPPTRGGKAESSDVSFGEGGAVDAANTPQFHQESPAKVTTPESGKRSAAK
jgi:hypothetical protein